MTLNTGIEEKERTDISRGLSKILANTYLLYIKTQNFHWNVTGDRFQQLHQMFEEQYQNLALAIDEIAERIRALGCFAPGSYKEFTVLSDIKEAEGRLDAKEMIKDLLKGNETIARNSRDVIMQANSCHDEATADLLTSRTSYHEKTSWMLRSLID